MNEYTNPTLADERPSVKALVLNRSLHNTSTTLADEKSSPKEEIDMMLRKATISRRLINIFDCLIWSQTNVHSII